MEFRKIKSLDCMYEINCDGTIVRNVKSKKIKKQTDGYIQLTFHKKQIKRYIHQLVEECWITQKPVDKTYILICPDNTEIYYDSKKKLFYAIAELTGGNAKTIRSHIEKRNFYKGYSIRSVETVRVNGIRNVS